MSSGPGAFKLSISNYRCFSAEPAAVLTLESGLTALVGPNNSGKSTVLRFFHEMRPLFGSILQAAQGVQLFTNSPLPGGALVAPRGDTSDAFFDGNADECVIDCSRCGPAGVGEGRGFAARFLVTMRRDGTGTAALFGSTGEKLTPNPNAAGASGAVVRTTDGHVLGDLSWVQDVARLLADTHYVPAFRNVLALSGETTQFDALFGEEFIKRWHTMKGSSRHLAEIARQVETELAEAFDFSDVRIDPSADGRSFRVWCDKRTVRIDELGAGFTQVFLVLTEAAKRRPSLLLIDEPELGLHPTLQRRFLSTLQRHTTYGVVFATHNLALAHACGARIYAVQLHPRGSRLELYDTATSLPRFLEEMTFARFRELGAGEVLLVEGKTEVPTIREFLRKLDKAPQVLLLSLAGDNMINVKRHTVRQLHELKRLGHSVSALIDSEKTAEDEPLKPERQRFSRLCERLSIRTHVLSRRAIENYFPASAIQEVLGRDAALPGEYGAASWDKNENPRLARATAWSDIRTTDLGQFLEAL